MTEEYKLTLSEESYFYKT